MKKIFAHSELVTIIISAIIILLLVAGSGFFSILNKTIQNRYYSIKNDIRGISSHPSIILVELDDQSLREIGTFPFPRSYYTQVIENLQDFDVAVIAFDFLFLDQSTSIQDDKELGEIILESGNIVLGSAINKAGEIQEPHISLRENNTDPNLSGFLPPNVDVLNNTVYSFSPIFTDSQGLTQEHFTLNILRKFYSYLYENPKYLEQGNYNNGDYHFSDEQKIPFALSGESDILINYIPSDSFQRISFYEILDFDTLSYYNSKYSLKDSIVLIGPAAEGFNDEFYTPNGREYGMYVHANILNTFLQREFMVYFDRIQEWLLIFLLVIVSVYTNLSKKRHILILGNLGIILFFWLVFPVSILLGTNLILNFPAQIIFSLLLSFTAANIVKYLIEEHNRKKLNSALSEYVSRDIAEEIIAGDGKVKLDGEKKYLLCFFSDIEGFTTLSEQLSPEDLIRFLREYLGEMTEIIMQHGGHIDKFEGDAIMGLWGAFGNHDRSNYYTICSAALAQQRALKNINLRWKTLLGSDISVRMGIHGGDAIVGNIGVPGQKMEFTAIGDNVNLASRLEGVNKFYKTYICISEEVQKNIKSDFLCRYLDTIQVKGKDIPVKIYELQGFLSNAGDEEYTLIEHFEKAVNQYISQDFQGAKKLFSNLAKNGDLPSHVYIQRCEHYIKNPPSKDWNGVWKFDEK